MSAEFVVPPQEWIVTDIKRSENGETIALKCKNCGEKIWITQTFPLSMVDDVKCPNCTNMERDSKHEKE